jgi:hypothetical protein
VTLRQKTAGFVRSHEKRTTPKNIKMEAKAIACATCGEDILDNMWVWQQEKYHHKSCRSVQK